MTARTWAILSGDPDWFDVYMRCLDADRRHARERFYIGMSNTERAWFGPSSQR